MYIDTHAHLNMPDFADLPSVLKRAEEAGVDRIIDVAFDLDSARASLKLSSEYDSVFSAVGIHPHDSGSLSDPILDEIRKMASGKKVAAIGEIGLDYYRNLSPKESQISAFRAQVALAQEMDLPVIVHSRDSHDDVLRILHEENAGRLRGVMHCFSGDTRVAQLALDLGFYISFAGTLTFKKAKGLREAAGYVPVDSILIETDCPYLAPDPHRGEQNEPALIIHTAAMLAEVKGIELEEVARRTSANARALFRII